MLLAGKSYAFGWLLTHGKWAIFRKWLVISDLMVFGKARNAWLFATKKILMQKKRAVCTKFSWCISASIPLFVLCYARRFTLHETSKSCGRRGLLSCSGLIFPAVGLNENGVLVTDKQGVCLGLIDFCLSDDR